MEWFPKPTSNQIDSRIAVIFSQKKQHQQKQEQKQPLMDFENGVIVKIYKS